MSWVAIAGGTIAAAGAVGGSLIAANSSKGGGGGNFPEMKAEFNPISNVAYNPKQGAQDFAANLGSYTSSANAITKNQTAQREKIMPGSANQFRLASNVLQSYLQGQVPQDVVDFTNRTVAERTGGSFNPFTQGGQSPTDFARSIGRLSSDYTSMGLSAAPTWQQLANSFVTSPLQVGQLANQMAATRYQYDALNSGIDQFNETGQYSAGLNQYRAGTDQYMADAAANSYQNSQMQQMIGTGANLLGTGIQAAFSGNSGSSIPSQRPTGFIGANGTFYNDLGPLGNYGRGQLNSAAMSPTGSFSPFGATGNPYKTGA